MKPVRLCFISQIKVFGFSRDFHKLSRVKFKQLLKYKGEPLNKKSGLKMRTRIQKDNLSSFIVSIRFCAGSHTFNFRQR